MSEPGGIIPYLCASPAAAAIDFYRRAFDAKERYRMAGEGGHIRHAELAICGSTLYLSDESPAEGSCSPRAFTGHSVSFVLAVADAPAAMERALAAGAVLRHPLAAAPYGPIGWVVDPFGHQWQIWQPDPDYHPPV